MKLRIAKKVLRNDAIRWRMQRAFSASAADVWLMNEIFGRYRQSTIDHAMSRFFKWTSSQAKWAAEHWDQIKPEPIPESALQRLSEMIAANHPQK